MKQPGVFSIGDRVVIVRSPLLERIGQIATVVSALYRVKNWSGRVVDMDMHELDIPPMPNARWPKARVTYPPSHLEHYRDDGDEKADLRDMPQWIKNLVREGAPA